MGTGTPVDVSVVICVRNAATTLGAQLKALAAQSSAPQFEVLIIDNGSDDGSVEVARSWIDSGAGAATSARIVDASAKVGICHARNEGARAAAGSVLAYCDADDVVTPTWIKAVADGSRRGHTFMTGRIYELDAQGVARTSVIRDSPDAVPGCRAGVSEIPYAWGCNFALTKKAFAAVGGFDEGLPPYGCDDIEIGIRAAQCGVVLAYEPAMGIHYRRRTGWRNKTRREFRVGVAQACLWARHPSVYGPVPTLSQLILRLVLDTIRTPFVAPGSPKDRMLATMLTLSSRLGAVNGVRVWVRGDRLAPPRLIQL